MENNNYINNDINNEIGIKDVLMILLRHKNLIFLCVIIALAISFYYTFTVSPVYKASTSIMLKNSAQDSFSFMDLTGNNKKIEIENEKILMQSRIVAENTIRELWESDYRNNLHILGTRDFVPRGQKKRKLIKEIFTFGYYNEEPRTRKILNSNYNLDSLRQYSKRVTDNLDVVNQRNTNIFTLTFSSPFPEEATIVVDKIAKSYMDIDRQWASNQASSILNFIDEQSRNIEKELSIAEEKLKGFKENKGIYDLTGNSELLLKQLVDVESMYYNTVAEINIFEETKKYLSSKLSQEEKTLANKLLNSINAKLLALRAQISQKESELVKNSTLHGEEHAAVIKLNKEIGMLKNKLDEETDLMINQGLVVADPVEYRQELIQQLLAVEGDLSSSKAKADEYNKLVAKYNEQLNTLPSLQLSFARLERDRSVLNQTYLFMRQELEKARIKVASEPGKVQIVDKAVVPHNRHSPKHKTNLMLGAVLGFVVSVCLIALIEYFDNTVKTIDDVDPSLTLLGIIPSISSNNNNNLSASNRLSFKYFKKRFIYYKNIFISNSLLNGGVNSKEIKRHLITHEQPKSPISEAYRSLRTSIMYSSADSTNFKSMVVSSSGPGEGKTTSIANLAITYADLGKKVLLIDTDLRRPVLHGVFNVSKEDGITSYLSGEENDFSKLIKKTKINNLSVVTAGIIPPNPSELLGSSKMKTLITELKNQWDIVLFDSPPLLAVTDATIISKYTDKMVLIIMPGKTEKKALSHCTNTLKNMNSALSGIVFNGVDSKNSYGSYYYYYQYYNYYGEGNS